MNRREFMAGVAVATSAPATLSAMDDPAPEHWGLSGEALTASELNSRLCREHRSDAWLVLRDLEIDVDEVINLPDDVPGVMIQDCRAVLRPGVTQAFLMADEGNTKFLNQRGSRARCGITVEEGPRLGPDLFLVGDVEVVG